MRIKCILLIIALLICAGAQTINNDSQQKINTLLVYDELDSVSKFYVDVFRERLQEKKIGFKEIEATTTRSKSVEGFNTLCLYSRVMAFTMKAPVAKWIASLPSLQNTRVYLFVTANRWLYETHLGQLKAAIKKKGGTVVDAVSGATNELSKEKKVQWVSDFAGMIE